MKKKIIKSAGWSAVLLMTIMVLTGCKKYLDEKPDQTLVIPSTIQDVQALLDNYLQVNQRDPYSAEVSSDDYYLTSADFLALNENERNIYTWQKENFYPATVNNDWAWCYSNINRANLVLGNLDNIKRNPGDQPDWDNAVGHAYFIRGRSFLLAVSIWSPAYDEQTASADAGIPLRLSPEFNTPSTRASVKASYDQVVSDLKQAALLLPVTTIHKTRPGKAAALALLARTYLWTRQYDSCFKYANLALGIHSDLKDFNDLPIAAIFPFAPIQYNNPEDLANFVMAGPPNSLSQSRAKIDSVLYNSYDNNDLRKKIFFRANTGAAIGSYSFKGSFFGNTVLYDGITTAETLLMRSECFGRANNVVQAMEDLNTLIIKRWNNQVAYAPITATNKEDALEKILQERRRELVMRGLRWMDIKRLNKEGRAIVLKRSIDGQEFVLLPNDKRYALPIPEDVIALSGMPQNDR
jgi:tetratricopeptide (TPR) repeat protein